MTDAKSARLLNGQTLLFLGFIILLSYLTYFHRYWEPPAVFWDENYHIASAQKYLHGVFFMEQHPPLGKLLVSAGEKLLHPNARTDQFLGTDYGTEFKGISFAGYRFFSAFLGWWTAALLFFIFLLITRNSLFAAFLSFLYVFDNALIVHLRGAMLEGPLMFFSALTILLFFLLREYRDHSRIFHWLSLAFGVSFALVITTKLFGMLFILLVPAVCAYLYPRWKHMLIFLALFVVGLVPVYVAIWQIHFSLGHTINKSLPDAGYYQASPAYKTYLADGRHRSILAFPVMIRDSWHFVSHYNNGAPRLDLCKPDENGSPWYFWPFGGRTINYRWETPDSNAYRYLYLVPNPAAWFAGLFGVLLAIALLLSSVFLPPRVPLRHPLLLALFTGMYAAFFVAVSRIGRVLYLYHSFTPLLLSFIIVALLITDLRSIGRWKLDDDRKSMALLILAALIFGSYQFYRPLTRYEPLTDQQFARRNLFSLWELTCVRCKKESGIVIPR